MAYTKIADVIVPEVFTPYVIQRSRELSLMVNSGIARESEQLNSLVSGGGKLINMPYWNILSGVAQVLDDTNPITSSNITASQDVAALQIRGTSWAAHELASSLAGSSAMQAIATQVAEWMVEEEEDNLLAILKGIFAGPLATSHMNDISGGTGAAAVISGDALIDTRMMLGDAYRRFSALLVHPKTYAVMQKQNLIDTIPDQRGEIHFNTYMGYPILVEDRAPVDGDVYTTYLFTRGCIARGTGIGVDMTSTEVSRDAAMSTDYLYYRWARVVHPTGIKWLNTTVASTTPSDAEFAMGTNWEKVYPDKHIGIVALRHKVA